MRRAGDQPTAGGKVRRWLRVHADVLAIFVMTTVMVVGVWHLGEQQDAERGRADVASCERGNTLRSYLAFDNAESILVLRASLQASPQQGLSDREQRAREESLARRIEAQKALTSFPCETLR